MTKKMDPKSLIYTAIDINTMKFIQLKELAYNCVG